jgi:hypothetical protein
MTDFNYGRSAATAVRLLKRFGAAASVLRAGDGDPVYNPETGTTAPPEVALPTVAAVFDYEQKYIDGTLVKQGDKQALCSPTQKVEQGDRLRYKSDTGADAVGTVISVKPLAPAGVAVLYTAQIRG